MEARNLQLRLSWWYNISCRGDGIFAYLQALLVTLRLSLGLVNRSAVTPPALAFVVTPSVGPATLR